MNCKLIVWLSYGAFLIIDSPVLSVIFPTAISRLPADILPLNNSGTVNVKSNISSPSTMVSLNTAILTLLVVIPLGNVTVWFIVLKSTSPVKKQCHIKTQCKHNFAVMSGCIFERKVTSNKNS